QATFIVVTHDIATARRVADHIGMLYLRNLVQFGTNKEMFESDIPVVRQFLAGATQGPIGMSEEADQGRQGGLGGPGGPGGPGSGSGSSQPGSSERGRSGPGSSVNAISTYGMTAERTEE